MTIETQEVKGWPETYGKLNDLNMKININYLLWLPMIFLTATKGCKDPVEQWDYIKVVNTTAKTIYVSAGTRRYGMSSYPDTLLPADKPSLLIVRPNDYNNLATSIGWEVAIKDNDPDSLNIYVFDADTINRYSWDKIKAHNKVLKRYDLSIDDLKRKNWSITFP